MACPEWMLDPVYLDADPPPPEPSVLARNRLVEDNILLAYKMTSLLWRRPDVRRGLRSREEVTSICLETLVRAAGKFDPNRGLRFSTYVCASMRNEVLKRRQYGLIRLPQNCAFDLARTAAGREGIYKTKEANLKAAAIAARFTKKNMLPALASREESPLDLVAARLDADHDAAAAAAIRQRIDRQLASLPDEHARALRLRFGLDDGAERKVGEVARQMNVSMPRARWLVRHGLDLLAG